jgi:hypothetical protein
LEKHINVIVSEKELWREAAHTIALKVNLFFGFI